ncbi:hypothetical protein BC332_34204 [Capsicum chinense]|uniref:Uncharacterized protein n=2 Tax=Capsicum annuum TaxID=4072 RepID=A0A075W1Z6_CAPAN|nr:hypothetical protein [Capsicum annuum]YP_009049729.1 hypothetical protein [Capsicum annuum]PHT96864.1 hypothetical protein BC332_34204 [Capsicum chinense]QFV19561.1 hypothetical protein [Capsicum annuum var. glabriusculum]AIG89941.1 hypothetical protein [Capsicum annuum]AIG90071.1 hypothetical protein [Capsicum annuum]AIG90087.1 hypothetical protein [Capsicum annuum]
MYQMAVSPFSKLESFKLGRSRKARTGTPRAAGAPNLAVTLPSPASDQHSNTPKHTSDTQSSNWHIISILSPPKDLKALGHYTLPPSSLSPNQHELPSLQNSSREQSNRKYTDIE